MDTETETPCEPSTDRLVYSAAEAGARAEAFDLSDAGP
jgi:hypothetical protein